MIKNPVRPPWKVIDLFSGAGGMSYGFQVQGDFEIVGAVDGEFGKPSDTKRSLQCNRTYALNMGIEPVNTDIADLTGPGLAELFGLEPGDLDVLIACSPCTGLSRANPNNHLYDDPRNSLIVHVAHFVDHLRPRILWMENAREMLQGNFSHHFSQLRRRLEALGYAVHADVYMLSDFGLPQQRERSLVVAVAPGLELRSMRDLWQGLAVDPSAVTVMRAIHDLASLEAGCRDENDPWHACPSMQRENLERIRAIPRDGGSWADLLKLPDGRKYMTPAMKRSADAGKLGSYPDVYGRMAWSRRAPTVKRECGHIGNGRYAHPEQDRLCSLRELALLTGFPRNYQFGGRSLSNMYRHVGDAVPPLVSYQVAQLTSWIFGSPRPSARDLVLDGTSLLVDDIVPSIEAVRSEQPLLDSA